MNRKNGASIKPPLVGVAIAVHNRIDRTRECLEAMFQSNYPHLFVCVVDDGSNDGTWEMIENDFPQIKAVRGDGTLWWSGATNLAIKACLRSGCDYVLLLNQDCIVNPDTISKLAETAQSMPGAVVASVVLDIGYPEKIWWAGSVWGPVKGFPFLWFLRHKFKHGEPVDVLPDLPFNTSDFTGRAVLISKQIFESVDLIDAKTFPQYAGDNEFGLRVTNKGYRAVVEPHAKSLLYVDETGQNVSGKLIDMPGQFIKRMFYRKHGEVARCWWHLLRRYAPSYAFWPSYLSVWVITFLGIFRLIPTPYQRKHHE